MMNGKTCDSLEDVIKAKPSQQRATIFNDGTHVITMSYQDMLAKSTKLSQELKSFICRNDKLCVRLKSNDYSSTDDGDNINVRNESINMTAHHDFCIRNNGNNHIDNNNIDNNTKKNNNNVVLKMVIAISNKITLDLPMVLNGVIQTSLFVFMPLSFQSPESILSNQIQQCKLKWMLVTECEIETLTEILERKRTSLQIHRFQCSTEYVLFELDIPEQILLPREMVYIVQTSATTGEPKRIYVRNNCIVPNILDLKSIFGMRPSDVILLSSSITFDASLVQMFLAWSTNACLMITPQALIYKTLKFVQALKDVTILQCTPSLLQILGYELLAKVIFTEETRLRVLALGGEKFVAKKKFLKLTEKVNKAMEFYNIYGTSEVSSWATTYHLTQKDLIEPNLCRTVVSGDRNHVRLPLLSDDSDWIPIGEPLSGTVIEVHDENGENVVEGCGELYIGGVDRFCYLNDEAMATTKRLRPTGDIAYVTSKSNNELIETQIFICGRKGSEVKRNGQLVSLASLTNNLNTMDIIESCVCVFEQEILYVFLQIPAIYDFKETERLCLEKIHLNLPSSHVPDRFIFVKNIPITPHGKIDKHKLLAEARDNNMLLNVVDFKDYVKECWQIALNDTSVHSTMMESTFIGCGGDSFSAIFFLNRVLQYFPSNNFVLGCSYENLFTKTLTSTLAEILALFENIAEENNSLAEVVVENSIGKISYQRDNHSPRLCNHYIAYQKQNDTSRCGCSDLPMNCSRNCYLRQTYHYIARHQNHNGISSCGCSSDFHKKTLDSRNDRIEVFSYEGNSTSIRAKWKYNLGKCVDASPLIVFSTDFPSGIVYIGCHSSVFAAISLADGAKIYDQVVNNRIESTAVMSEDGNSVIFGCFDGGLYSLDSKTGIVEWSYKTGDAIKSTPVIFNHLVLFASHDKHIYAIDSKTKKLSWKYHTGSACSTSPLIDHIRGCVYITLLSGTVVALEVSTGTLLWKLNIGKPIFTSPCLCKEFIVFGSVDENFYAVDFKGKIKWKFKTKAPIFSSPICIDLEKEEGAALSQLLIFGCNDHNIYCLNNQGIVVWKYLATSKVVASVTVYNNNNHNNNQILPVNSLKRKICNTGSTDQITSSGANFVGSTDQITSSRTDFVGSTDQITSSGTDFVGFRNNLLRGTCIVYSGIDGNIGLLDITEGGRLVASYKCEGELFSSPVVVDDVIVVGCRDDNVYCLQIVSG